MTDRVYSMQHTDTEQDAVLHTSTDTTGLCLQQSDARLIGNGLCFAESYAVKVCTH